MRQTDTATDFTETARNVATSAEAELAALRDKVETLMKERVTPVVADLAGRAEAVATDAAASVRRESERLGQGVRDHPLAALGIAAAAGFVIAMLMRR